ncbi:MAG: NAD(P)-binding protein [Catenulispora sp.]|nr:NAD(P)-binding protein [Catenulispora sp.]
MARTQHVHFLRALAADHAAADRLQLPVAEYRELRDEALAEPDGPSRRALLRRSVALGLGVAAFGTQAVRSRPAHADVSAAGTTVGKAGGPNARVAIVGAGISGLAAALTLADKGVAATVYEANPVRIGGRMYSQGSPANPGFWDQGQVSEYGGELVDTGHHTLIDLCQRFGLGLTPVRHVYGSQADQVLWFQGGYYDRAQADADFQPVYKNIQSDMNWAKNTIPGYNNTNPGATALDGMSIVDWINTRVPGGEGSKLGAFLDVAYNVEYGADCADQSAWALLSLLAYQTKPAHFNIWGLSDERYHITGGNDQLPQLIEAALPAGTVQRGMTLLAVVRNADGTQTLTFATDGGGTRTVTADHTVLAVPLPILQQHVDLSKAGLDPMMQGVLANMRMGYCTKLNMQFTGRPWVGTGPWPGSSNGEAFADLAFQQVWDVTRGQSGSNGILIQYGGGSLAYGLKPPSAFTDASAAYTRNLVGSYLAQIEKLFPGTTALWNGKAKLSAWHLNPYSYGAYSMWPVNYVHQYAGYERVAQGNLHFAGEHTSTDFQGYMNGGADEGQRAGNEVLAALGM